MKSFNAHYRGYITETYKFTDQTFSDGTGVWHVPDIEEFARTRGKKQRMAIKDLLHNLEPSPHESGSELPGHKKFIARANKASLEYPIIVVRYPDGMFIADGVHRLWKANEQKLIYLDTYLIDHKDLWQIETVDQKQGESL